MNRKIRRKIKRKIKKKIEPRKYLSLISEHLMNLETVFSDKACTISPQQERDREIPEQI
jgi:hypothetical protein